MWMLSPRIRLPMLEMSLLEARRHVQVYEEAPVTEEGDAQQEQSDPSSGDRPMTEVREAPVTGEGDFQQD